MISTKYKFKQIAILIIILVCITIMAGCGEGLRSSCSNISGEFDFLKKSNISILNELQKDGLLTEDDVATVNNNISDNLDPLENALKINDDSSGVDFNSGTGFVKLQAISWISPVLNGDRLKVANINNVTVSTKGGETKLSLGDEYKNCSNFFISNNIIGNINNLNGNSYNMCIDGVTQSNVIMNRVNSTTPLQASDGSVWYNTIPDTSVKQETSDGDVIDIVSKDVANGLLNTLNSPVYVLKADAFDSGDGTKSIDTICEVIKTELDSSESDADKISKLGAYFEKAQEVYIDNDGNQKTRDLTLLDTSIESTASGSEQNLTNQITDNIIQVTKSWSAEEASKMSDFNSNILGRDFVINEYGVPTMQIKLREFNQEAYDKLCALLSLHNDKYKILKNGTINAVYLMEYNSSTINSLELSNSNIVAGIRDPYESGYSDEQYLSVNMYSGDIYKNIKNNNGSISSTEIKNTDNEGYLVVSGTADNSASSRSAFIASGTTLMSVGGFTLSSGGNNEVKARLAKVPRLILRDYLELIYAPSYITDEQFVALGRKMRFNILPSNTSKTTVDMDIGNDKVYKLDTTKISWTLSSGKSIANYVDIKGDKVSDSSDVMYTDFADVSIFYDGYSNGDFSIAKGSVVRLKQNNENISDSIGYAKIADGNVGDSAVGNLPTYVSNKISVGQIFPGKYVDKSDSGESEANQVFFAMTLNTSMFDKGLYDSWVNVSQSDVGKEYASLEWWIGWLKKNNYKYNLDHNALNDYLKNNYTYEVSKSTGMIVISPETVTKIQNEYKTKDQIAQNKRFNSLFYIIGFIFLVGSLLVILAWIFDTNIDLGINLLTYISFGKWVAIKYDSDLPSSGNSIDGKHYLTLSKVLKKCIVLDIIGLLFIAINAFTLVYWVISTFGGIAKVLEKIFTGIYG